MCSSECQDAAFSSVRDLRGNVVVVTGLPGLSAISHLHWGHMHSILWTVQRSDPHKTSWMTYPPLDAKFIEGRILIVSVS